MTDYPLEIAALENELYAGTISLRSLGTLEEHYARVAREEPENEQEATLALARIYDIATRYAHKKLAVTGKKYILYLNDKATRNSLHGKSKSIAFADLPSFMADPEGLGLLLDMLRVPEVGELRIARRIADANPSLLALLMTAAARAHKDCSVTEAPTLSHIRVEDLHAGDPTRLPEVERLLREKESPGNACPDVPAEIHIDPVVGTCNIACRFCPSGIKGIPKRVMDLAVFKQAVEAIPKDMPIKTILTPFTEPFIIRNYLDLVEYAILKRPVARIGFNTNAVAMHKKRAERLVDMQVKYLVISMNMPDRESYKWFHGHDFYNRVVENVHTLKKIRDAKGSLYPQIYVQFLEHSKTSHLVPAALAYWRSVADSAVLRRMAIPGDSPEVRKQLLGQIGEDPHKNQIATKYPCRQIYLTLAVDIRGYYLPCTNLETARSIHPTNPDIHEEMVLGHVRDMSFLEAWRSKKFKEIRALQWAGQLPACRGCVNRQYTESALFGLRESMVRHCFGV